MGVGRNKSCPRRMFGGRAASYEHRRNARGGGAEYAPSWSDGTAQAMLAHVHALKSTNNISLAEQVLRVLREDTRAHADAMWLSAADKAAVAETLDHHAERLGNCKGHGAAHKLARSVLRALNKRRSRSSRPKPLRLQADEITPTTLSDILSARPEEDRSRNAKRSHRMRHGISRWPLGWLDRPGVVCYERAEGRIAGESGGVATESLVRSLVKTGVLPTAVSSPSDHYVVLQPGRPPRYATVPEVARCFGIRGDSPLLRMLNSGVLSATRAVAALGRAVHAGVAARIVETLLGRGVLQHNFTYGSAHSGIDVFAEGARIAARGSFRYLFASESVPYVRAALVSAWNPCGLTASAAFSDAAGSEAIHAPVVDLYVTTPPCEEFSRRSRANAPERRAGRLGEIWASLDYVRRARPRAVVVENVCEACAVNPISGLLGRVQGYASEGGELDPRDVAGACVSRSRYYWVLTRVDGRLVGGGQPHM